MPVRSGLGRVNVSNRPDLCEYQCNGALAAAKQFRVRPSRSPKRYHPAAASTTTLVAVMPGFINLKLSGSFLQQYLEQMRTSEAFGLERSGEGKTIVVDYSRPDISKAPAHRPPALRHHRREPEAAVRVLRLPRHR